MRLIDADALMEYIGDEFDGVCVYDVSGNEAAREFCGMVDIAPTIDAIPVTCLEDIAGRYEYSGCTDSADVVMAIIKGWNKEHEVR